MSTLFSVDRISTKMPFFIYCIFFFHLLLHSAANINNITTRYSAHTRLPRKWVLYFFSNFSIRVAGQQYFQPTSAKFLIKFLKNGGGGYVTLYVYSVRGDVDDLIFFFFFLLVNVKKKYIIVIHFCTPMNVNSAAVEYNNSPSGQSLHRSSLH